MKSDTKKITTIGMMCSLAIIVNLLIHFPIVPAVSFLRYDPKDIIIVMAGFIYGPSISLGISAITSVLELMYRGGTILDVLMNMISSCTFACTAAYFYRIHHTKKGAVTGLILGTLLSTVSMLLWNYIVTPIYFQMPRSAVVEILLPGILPFNLLKSGLNAAITIFIYKRFVTLLRSKNMIESTDTDHHKNILAVMIFILITVVFALLGMKGII